MLQFGVEDAKTVLVARREEGGMTNFWGGPKVDKLRDRRLYGILKRHRHCQHPKYMSQLTEDQRVENRGSTSYGDIPLFVNLTTLLNRVKQFFSRKAFRCAIDVVEVGFVRYNRSCWRIH